MHTGRVDVGYLGIALVLVVGTAVVAYGWLADRTETRRRQDALTQAPDRPIPGLRQDASAPAYVTEDEALHGSSRPAAVELTASERTRLQGRLAGAPRFPHGYAAASFVNDPASGLCVLRRPTVLVVDGEVTTVRELLGFLEKSLAASRRVVIVAAGLSRDVLATLQVNANQQMLECVAVVIPEAGRRRALCSLVRGAPVSRDDLRAGYVPDDRLGTCGIWVSGANESWILDEEGDGGPS